MRQVEVRSTTAQGREGTEQKFPMTAAELPGWGEGFIPKRYGVGMNVGGPEHTGPARQV